MNYSFILILKNVQIIKEQEHLPAQKKSIKAKVTVATKVQTVRSQTPKEHSLFPGKKKDSSDGSRHAGHSNVAAHENTAFGVFAARSGEFRRYGKQQCKK